MGEPDYFSGWFDRINTVWSPTIKDGLPFARRVDADHVLALLFQELGRVVEINDD
jgi:hypothetical protein